MRRGRVCAAIALTTCFLLVFTAVYALWENCVWPDASGEVVVQDHVLLVDASNAAKGYFMVRVEETSSARYKLLVQTGNKKVPYYDLSADGEWTVLPFQLGSGKYTITLYKQASKGYANAGKVTVDVALSDENAPFLVTNQYVHYTQETEAVAISDELCVGLTSDAEKLEAIRVYIHDNYTYDYQRAATVTSGTLPDIDYCTTNKMGICQDLAAMAVCMLRVQGISARFVIGYAGSQYHAWLVAEIDGTEVRYDPTNDMNDVTLNQYTVERYY